MTVYRLTILFESPINEEQDLKDFAALIKEVTEEDMEAETVFVQLIREDVLSASNTTSVF